MNDHYDCGTVGPHRRILRPKRTAIALLVVVGLLLMCGCKDQRVPSSPPTTEVSKAASTAINRTYSAGGTSDAPGISVLVSVDRSEMTTADRLRMTLSLATRDGTTLEWLLPNDRLGDFQIAESSQLKGVRNKGLTINVYAFLLEPFLEGSKVIPSMTIPYREGAASTRGILATEPITIEVRSVLAAENESAELAPIKPPFDFAKPSNAASWVVTGIAGLLAIGYPLAFVMARYASQRRTHALDPVEVVKHRLANLRSRINVQEPDDGVIIKTNAADLAAILREYLSALVHDDVRGRLTPEIADLVRQQTGASSSTEEVLKVLDALDQQRFSSVSFSKAHLAQYVDVMEQFVATTCGLLKKEGAT